MLSLINYISSRPGRRQTLINRSLQNSFLSVEQIWIKTSSFFWLICYTIFIMIPQEFLLLTTPSRGAIIIVSYSEYPPSHRTTLVSLVWETLIQFLHFLMLTLLFVGQFLFVGRCCHLVQSFTAIVRDGFGGGVEAGDLNARGKDCPTILLFII